MRPAATTIYGAIKHANSIAPLRVRMVRFVMYLRQNSGNATSDNTISCGRHPTTRAMHRLPPKYQPQGRFAARPRIHRYKPHTENASPMEMGSE